MKGILGRKIGMTQVFTVDGELIPVTLVEATPNIVMQVKTVENDGYEAVQLGFEDVKESRANKPSKGHAAKANTAPKHFLKEIRGNEMNVAIGDEVKVDIFEPGDLVDVQGTSKGKGYQGTIVRNNAHQGPRSHGGSKNIRHIGSLATIGITSRAGKISKGTIMAGHEGHYTTTVQNLEVIKVDVDQNYILIKGSIPGPKKGVVLVKGAVKKSKAKGGAKTLVDYSVQEG